MMNDAAKPSVSQGTESLSFRRLIGTSIAAKLAVDIGSQIFNPFLPLIASGLGLGVVQLGRLVGLRSAMGVFAPVSGALSDRFGYRLVIRVTLLITAAGCLGLAASHALWMVVASIMLIGLGGSSFVPNLQAYVSTHLPYAKRARGLGMIEYSWALTGIVGLSLIGLLIAATGWRTPFYLLALALVAMSVVFGAMPGRARQNAGMNADGIATAQGKPGLWRRFLSIFVVNTNRRSTYATIVAATLSYFAAMQVMLMHGAWLAGRYGLDAAQLGLVALVLGCFDLTASVTVSLVTDRIGKRRSVMIGIFGSLVAYVAMPFLDTGVIQAIIIIALARMCFEFNIVSHFPLLSEQAPAQRGQVMTLSAAMTMLGGTLAGFTGPWLYVNLGVGAMAWTSAGAVAVALAIVFALVRDA
ncbi:MAG TPA: MFS transporter [bacterium]|nr:MFS transporter [bacterium]